MKKTISIIAILVLCITMATVFNACDFQTEDDKTTKQTTVYSVGETAQFESGVKITVVSATIAKSIDGIISKVTTENQFIIVKIKVYNNSKDTYTGLLSTVWLDYNGAKIEQTDDVFLIDKHFSGISLSATLTNEYIALFETADSISLDDVTLKISDNSFWNEKILQFKLV